MTRRPAPPLPRDLGDLPGPGRSFGQIAKITAAGVVALAVGAALVPASTSASATDGTRTVTVVTVTAVQKGDPCKVGRKAVRKQATQVVVVRSSGTRATVTACTRTDEGRYVVALRPASGWVGRGGVAPKGAKREGDGRTPRGTFPLGRGFGVQADPGLRHHSWMQVDDRDVWVDDPRSALYNRHARLPSRGRWSSAERLRIAPYDYAQVIGYNRKRTPYRGSAIFLHVSTGGPTAGCVSLRERRLVRLLRWQRPGVVMVIR